MGEIKIVVSEMMEKIIEDVAKSLGVKKTEYVKGLVVEDFKRLKREGLIK